MRRSKIKNTIGMFDLLKGVIMLMVMLVHTYGLYDFLNGHGPLYIFLTYVTSGPLKMFAEAMMPVLFILGGYGLRKTTLQKCVKKQAGLLLIPYAITGLISVILTLFSFYIRYRNLREAVYKALELIGGFVLGFPKTKEAFGVTISWCGPAWFLLAMFVSIVIFNQLLNRFSGSRLLIVSFVAACVGWGLSFIPIVPWCLSQGLVATLYVCLGYFAKKEKILTERLAGNFKTIAAIVVILLVSLFSCQFGENNLADSEYVFGPFSIVLNGLLGIVIIYIFLHLNRFNGKISEWIRTIGRYSLYILCIHTIEFMSFGGILQMDFVGVFKGSVHLRNLIIFVVRTVIVVATTMGYAWIKNKYMNKMQREEIG